MDNLNLDKQKGAIKSRIFQEAIIFENLQNVYLDLRKGGDGLDAIDLVLTSLTTDLYEKIKDKVDKAFSTCENQKSEILESCDTVQRYHVCQYGQAARYIGTRKLPIRLGCSWRSCSLYHLKRNTTKQILSLVQDMLDSEGLLFERDQRRDVIERGY